MNLFDTSREEQTLRISATGWYNHLKKHGRKTGCCIPEFGIYCDDGRALKQDYLEMVHITRHHVH